MPGKLVHHAGMCGNSVVYIYGNFHWEKSVAVFALAAGVSGYRWPGKFWQLFGFHKDYRVCDPIFGSPHALCVFFV